MFRPNNIRRIWIGHSDTIMRIAIAGMGIAALVWLGYEFWRLVFQTGYWGAIDLKFLRTLTQRWFSGQSVYGESSGAMYPPTSFVIAFPFLGWVTFPQARWLWAGISVLALGWLIGLVVSASGANTRLEKIMIALIPLSMYATGAAIGNGQFITLIIPALGTGILWLRQAKLDWRQEFLAILFILLSLVKPTVSAPFFWIVLFATRRLRSAIGVVIGYLALTGFALSLQTDSPFYILTNWLDGSLVIAAEMGSANFSLGLAWLGLESWILPGAGLMLFALGIWVWFYRTSDLWVLMGVVAIVARLWVYHWWFDDLLIIFALVALYRIAKQGEMENNNAVVAGGLFIGLLVFSLAPGGLYLFPSPWNTVYSIVQVIIWLLTLLFLGYQASRQRMHRHIERNDFN